MANSKVDWYGDKVALLLKDASEDVINAAAFQTEAYAKVNIQQNDQIDTGFMMNSVYTIEANGDFNRSGVMPSGEYTGSKSGQKGRHEAVPVLGVPDGTAAVHVAANYAIYQEMKKSFLYEAVLTVKKLVGGQIRKVSKERNLD